MAVTLAFDVYGTLIDPYGIRSDLSRLVGGDADRFASVWRDKQIEYLFRRGLMGEYLDFAECTRHALDYTCEFLDAPLAGEDRQALMARYRELPAYTDAPDALKQLQEAGHRSFAFSNGRPDDLEALLANAGLIGFFEGIVSVHDVQSFKPDPAVYAHFLATAGCPAGDAWLISGNPFDVIGAIACGWNSAWVRRDPAAVFDPWGAEPGVTVTGLGELPGRIPR